MASRACPKCNSTVSVGALAAFSDGVDCPNCHTRLEVSPPARTLDAWAGLAAGFLAWRLTRGGPGLLGAALPLLYAILAFGFVSALVVMFAGDLRPAPETVPVEAAHAVDHADAAHGSHH